MNVGGLDFFVNDKSGMSGRSACSVITAASLQ